MFNKPQKMGALRRGHARTRSNPDISQSELEAEGYSDEDEDE